MADAGQMVSYRKSPFEDLDRIFWIALIGAFILESILVFWMAHRPADVYSDKEITRIQERFASFILKEEARQETIGTASVPVSETDGGGEGSATEEARESVPSAPEAASEIGGGQGGGVRKTTAEAVRESRARIAQEVSGKGLLGLLTGTGSTTGDEAVSGIFSTSGGAGAGTGDLDEILGNVGGLKTQGQSGLGGVGGGGGSGAGGARGGRAGGSATIDDLVSTREGVATESLTRKGELHLDSPTEFKGGGTKSTYRSPDVIHEVLLGHVNAIQYCYERELKRDPSLKGKITVRITVAPDGGVNNSEIVSSTLNNDRVERCILSRIQLWKDFPPIDPAEGDVTFRQVYTFGY